MFYLEDGWVKLYTGGQIIAPVSEIPKLISELESLNISTNSVTIKTDDVSTHVHLGEDIKTNDNIVHLDNLDEESDEGEAITDTLDLEDRYTSEGIDRLFRASSDFIVSLDRWNRESKYSWAGISGPDLFNGYQKHAEHYCEGCLEYGREPTYEGFRQWLINLRDQNIGNN